MWPFCLLPPSSHRIGRIIDIGSAKIVMFQCGKPWAPASFSKVAISSFSFFSAAADCFFSFWTVWLVLVGPLFLPDLVLDLEAVDDFFASLPLLLWWWQCFLFFCFFLFLLLLCFNGSCFGCCLLWGLPRYFSGRTSILCNPLMWTRWG